MPALDDIREVRAAEVIDGMLPCWRCDAATDNDGFCGSCGAVTIPAGSTASPTRATSSTSAIRRAVQLELEPDPFLNALVPAGIGGGLELRGSSEA